MGAYQRVHLLHENMVKERQALLESLVKTPPSDYAGLRFITGQVTAMDKIIENLHNILKDG